MNAVALEPRRTVILILPAVGEVFAMSTAALSTAQSSVEKLTNDYRDAIILSQDGSVRRFVRIDVVSPLGTSVLRRMISNMITRAKRIEVTLSEPFSMPLPELKALLIRCIVAGGYFLDPDADEAELHRVAVAIESAQDTAAIFRAFPLPEPEDALDGL